MEYISLEAIALEATEAVLMETHLKTRYLLASTWPLTKSVTLFGNPSSWDQYCKTYFAVTDGSTYEFKAVEAIGNLSLTKVHKIGVNVINKILAEPSYAAPK